MAAYRKTSTPGVYVRHQNACPGAGEEGGRCRCRPSYRGRRWDSATSKMGWSPTFGARAEVLTWLSANDKGQAAAEAARAAGPAFSALAGQWLEGIRTGAVGRRPSTGQAQHRLLGHDDGGLRAVSPVRPRARARGPAGWRHRAARMADVGRSTEPGGSVALADREPPGGRPGDLRLGDPPDPPLGRHQSAAGY
jgi:hypothetical protein